MPKLTDTYARAYDCCDALFIELGRFPTIDLIRERIGVNSPATIKKAMNEWTRHFAERHYDKVHRPDIPAALVGGMEQAWKLAVAEAEKAYLEREQGHLQALAASRVAKGAVEEENTFLSTTLGQARAQLAGHEAQAVALRQQLDAQAAELAGLSEQLRQAGQQLAGQQALAQEQAARWQHQQEQDQAWFARRIMEERQFAEDKHTDRLQRQARQIASLSESEATLQSLCAGLRKEQQRLQAELAAAKAQSKPSGPRFKRGRQPDKASGKTGR